jgi:phage gp36-like protein
MAYATQDDLLKLIPPEELAELTTEEGETPDAAIVSEAIVKADSEIDAYCGVRYLVPFEPAPARIKSLSVDLALYHLYSRRSGAPAVRRQKYDDAINFLRDLAAGVAVLSSLRLDLLQMGVDSAVFSTEPRLFSRQLLEDW